MEPCVRDAARGGTAAGRADEEVRLAVNDERGCLDPAQVSDAAASRLDRRELAAGASGVSATVEGRLGEQAQIVFIAFKPRGPDDLDVALDVFGLGPRRLGEQGRVQAQRRLSREEAAGAWT